MAPRTSTAHLPTLSFPSSGTFTFPIPASPASRTSYNIPPGSHFDSDLHWHESYTEFFQIHSGVMRLTLESSTGNLNTTFIGPGSGVVEIPRGRRHRVRRGDVGDGWKSWMADIRWKEGGEITRAEWEGEVRGEEWTDPMDGRKEAFFRNLAGVVGEPRTGGVWEGILVTVGVFAVMRRFDNWPALLGGRLRGLEWVLSHAVLEVVCWVGVLVDVRGEYEEYTPGELRSGGEGRKDL